MESIIRIVVKATEMICVILLVFLTTSCSTETAHTNPVEVNFAIFEEIIEESELGHGNEIYSGISVVDDEIVLTIRRVRTNDSQTRILFTLHGETVKATERLSKLDYEFFVSSLGDGIGPVYMKYDPITHMAYGCSIADYSLKYVASSTDYLLIATTDSMRWTVKLPPGENASYDCETVQIGKEFVFDDDRYYVDKVIFFPHKTILYYSVDYHEAVDTSSSLGVEPSTPEQQHEFQMRTLFDEIYWSLCSNDGHKVRFQHNKMSVNSSEPLSAEVEAHFLPTRDRKFTLTAHKRVWIDPVLLKPIKGECIDTNVGRIEIDDVLVDDDDTIEVILKWDCNARPWTMVSFRNKRTNEFINSRPAGASYSSSKWVLSEVQYDDLVIVVEILETVSEESFVIGGEN